MFVYSVFTINKVTSAELEATPVIKYIHIFTVKI